MKKYVCILTIALMLFTAFYVNTAPAQSTSSKNNALVHHSDSTFLQINQDGFGSIENVGTRGVEIFNGSLITATANYNNESKIVVGKTYGYDEFMDTYHSLYNPEYGLRSNGLEIWSYNGTDWRPLVANHSDAIMSAGFGNKNNTELGFLKVFKGYLYAGVKNHLEGAQVWRTNSIDNTWEKVAEGGFGNINNTAAWSAEEFYGYLYIGTMNWHYNKETEIGGCEMYRSKDGENWTAVVGGNSITTQGFLMPRQPGMNFYLWSMANYSGYLYAGTSFPGDIWRTSDGVNWEPFVAYDTVLEAKLHGAKYPRHFGRFYVGGIRKMQVYKDEVYFFSAQNYGTRKVMIEGCGNLISKIISKINFINIRADGWKFYFVGTQIWKYNSTTDKLTRVVGGFGNRDSSGGFGDRQNIYLWSVEADDEYMYVGTLHPDSGDLTLTRNGFKNWSICIEITKGHGQIWRYDGNNWECLVGEGKGLEFEDDEYNVGFRELKLYQDRLIGATMNMKTGCEVWEIKG
jgi:hypothetical protein